MGARIVVHADCARMLVVSTPDIKDFLCFSHGS
jgi:hypothetical protein